MKIFNKHLGHFGFFRCSSLLILPFMVACTTVGPEFLAPEVKLPANWQQKNTEKALPVALHLWANFNDPVLNGFIRQAEQENLSLQQGVLRILEARAQLGITNANIYPSGTLRANASQRTQSKHSQPQPLIRDGVYSLGFDSHWELDIWGRLLRQREAAVAHHSAQLADYDNNRLSISAEVARTYIGIRILQKRLVLLSESIELQESSLRIAEVWYQNGERTELALQQTRALVFETRAQLPALEQDLHQLESALALLLGTHRAAIIDSLSNGASIPEFNGSYDINIPADLLRRRPDVFASEQIAKMRNAQLGIQEAEYYPSFTLNGNLGFAATSGVPTLAGGNSGSSFADLFSSNALQHNIGLGFSWNIFNFERIDNNVRAADARLQQAIEAYKATVLAAVKESGDALNKLKKSRVQESLLTQSVTAYNRSTALSLQQYKDGAIDYQSVLDSLRQLVAIKQNQAQAKGQIALNLVTLFKSLGGGWNTKTSLHLRDTTKKEMTSRTNWQSIFANELAN